MKETSSLVHKFDLMARNIREIMVCLLHLKNLVTRMLPVGTNIRLIITRFFTKIKSPLKVPMLTQLYKMISSNGLILPKPIK